MANRRIHIFQYLSHSILFFFISKNCLPKPIFDQIWTVCHKIVTSEPCHLLLMVLKCLFSLGKSYCFSQVSKLSYQWPVSSSFYLMLWTAFNPLDHSLLLNSFTYLAHQTPHTQVFLWATPQSPWLVLPLLQDLQMLDNSKVSSLFLYTFNPLVISSLSSLNNNML